MKTFIEWLKEFSEPKIDRATLENLMLPLKVNWGDGIRCGECYAPNCECMCETVARKEIEIILKNYK